VYDDRIFSQLELHDPSIIDSPLQTCVRIR
jgi:hypothetical protein